MNTRKLFMFVTCLVLISTLFLGMGIGRSQASVSPNAIYSTYINVPITIDGILDQAYVDAGPTLQWHMYNDGMVITQPGSTFVYVLNNDTHLFLFFDLVPDTVQVGNEMIAIWLDTNNSKQVPATPDVRLYLGVFSVPASLIFQAAVSFGPSVNSPTNHMQVEIALNLSSMTNAPQPGDVMGYLFGYGNTGPTTYQYSPLHNYPDVTWGTPPRQNQNDETLYNEMVLAKRPVVVPPEEDYLVMIFVVAIIVGCLVSFSVGYLLHRQFSKIFRPGRFEIKKKLE